MKQLRILLLLSLCLIAAACGPKLIPGIEIEVADTPDHRALLSVMESYRKALEGKDVGALVALASPRYYEKSGSEDTADDYNYEGLNKHFAEHFGKVDQVAVAIQLKDLRVENNEATIDFHFTSRYLMKLPSGDKWQVADDINRMQLAREGDQWKILSGM